MATTFPAGTQRRLFVLLNLEPEQLLPDSQLKVRMEYVEQLEAQGAAGLVDIVLEALNDIDQIDSSIQSIDESGDETYTSLTVVNQFSEAKKSGLQGNQSQYLRESRQSKIALIEETLNMSAQNQGEFTYA